MLEDIKLLLGLLTADKDELLELLIKNAKKTAQTYTNDTDTSKVKHLIEKMVIYDYNRLGTEGLDAETYSGISYTYSSDYPESILKELRQYRKLRML